MGVNGDFLYMRIDKCCTEDNANGWRVGDEKRLLNVIAETDG